MIPLPEAAVRRMALRCSAQIGRLAGELLTAPSARREVVLAEIQAMREIEEFCIESLPAGRR